MMQSIRMTMNAKRAAQFLFGSVSAGLLQDYFYKMNVKTQIFYDQMFANSYIYIYLVFNF